MEKAYDFKELVKELKAKGLDVAEDAAREAVEAVLAWIEKSAIKSENKYDDLLLAVIPLAKDQIMDAVDKIDGKEEA